MGDPRGSTRTFATIEAVAAALNAGPGPPIEGQPGIRDPAAAGRVNRAIRAMSRTILRATAAPAEDLPAALSLALGRPARRRLEAEGLDRREVEHQLAPGPAGRDDRLAFLIPTAPAEVEHLLRTRGPDHDSPAAPTA